MKVQLVSISERNGIDFLSPTDKKIYSVGISTGGKSYSRYFHSQESIKHHLSLAGFKIQHIGAYREQLCVDFQRSKLSDQIDSLIEVLAIRGRDEYE